MTNSKQTVRLYEILMGRKLVDVPDHSTTAINICHKIAQCQCLTAERVKSRDTGGR